MTGAPVETPSGKSAGDENFPVGSALLPKRLRPHVAIFYAFARAADDIADNPALAADDKIRRLDAFDRALVDPAHDGDGVSKAVRMRESLAACAVSNRHCRDLLLAFKQDATKKRYRDWADLMGYCALSASPVGRYLLDLHGEAPSAYEPSDALCNALQVLNHLQDCADDYHALDRVYIPEPWLAAEGLGAAVLDKAASPPGLRHVLDRLLDRTDTLIAAARRLPSSLASTRLAMESAVIVLLAVRLARRLRRGDPLARRVALGRADFLLATLGGICWGLARRRRARTAGASGGA